jgi:glutamate-5-semialdehyde dehydrogenase
MTAYAPGRTSANGEITALTPGLGLLYAGNRLAYPSPEVRAAFRPGDRLLVIERDGAVLHVPADQHDLVNEAVTHAQASFEALRAVADEQVDTFFTLLAARLADDDIWQLIDHANQADVARATQRGRSTTRLIADARMRRRMIDGLAQWQAMPTQRGRVVATVQHDGWRVEQVADGLGVVAFVFEGRPNVLADACGVLKSGNTAVMRIGSDALGTARALMEHALTPALAAAGLPPHAVVLIDSAEHAAGWALFSHRQVALAVARGSGEAVAQLGAIASQAGVPVSLHGAGGAWMIVDASADPDYLQSVVLHSTDRKVCNTLNTLCLPRSRAAEFAQAAVAGLTQRAARLGFGYKLHVTPEALPYLPAALAGQRARMRRAEGDGEELIVAELPADQLGHEWEWEQTPEVTVHVVDDVDEAVQLFNQQSSRFVASLIANDPALHERFFRTIEAPCLGNGMTRWLDGQFALERPELGLTNWQQGRLFGRHSILTGDGVYTIRLRVVQSDPEVHQ